jgi:hypothetical protein
MTAVLHRPVTSEELPRGRRLPTPVWLRIMSAVLAGAALAAGVTCTVAILARQNASHAAISTGEPLVIDAETIDVSLSEANTAIAGGFLGIPPVGVSVERAYQGYLADADVAITAAARQSGSDPETERFLATLVAGVPLYSSTVATAETEYRETLDVASSLTGPPVATAYLAEANNVMRTELLPASAALYAAEQARLAHEESRATDTALVLVALGLLGGLLLVALWSQFQLARRFRRVVNLGLVVTTVLAIGVGIWTIVATGSADSAVATAKAHGTAPLAALTEARILAQQARADDELSLVTRASDPTYQTDYRPTTKSLGGLLGSDRPGWTPTEQGDLAMAAKSWSSYQSLHPQILQSIEPDDPEGPAAQSDATSLAYDTQSSLIGGVESSLSSFDSAARSASNDMSGLAFGCAALMVLAALAVLAGIEPRIREYR